MWLPLSWKTFRIGGDLSAISLNQFFLKGAHWMFYGISSSCNSLMHPCMHRSLQYPTYSKIHAPFTSRAPKKGPALKHQPALLMNVYVCMRVCVCGCAMSAMIAKTACWFLAGCVTWCALSLCRFMQCQDACIFASPPKDVHAIWMSRAIRVVLSHVRRLADPSAKRIAFARACLCDGPPI